jgi:hypothetical protein
MNLIGALIQKQDLTSFWRQPESIIGLNIIYHYINNLLQYPYTIAIFVLDIVRSPFVD